MEKRLWSAVSLGLLIGFGVFGAGYEIGKAALRIKAANRVVTVKGLAERDVQADLGIFEIDYREVGDNLITLSQKMAEDQATVLAFLKQQGFAEAEMETVAPTVNDRLGNPYSMPDNSASAQAQRYVITAGVRVRSLQVHLVDQVSRHTSLLLQKGVSLAFDSPTLPNPNPTYYFTQLDRVRPMMMAEATKSASLVAQQFVRDSRCRLGKIQQANQGVFQIMGRDSSSLNSDWASNQNALGSIDKKVRLVTTQVYQLQ